MIGDKAPNSLLSKDLFRNFILLVFGVVSYRMLQLVTLNKSLPCGENNNLTVVML